MIKFFKKHPYMIIGYIAVTSISIGVGVGDPSDGFIFFGIASAVLTVYAWMVNEGVS